MLPLLGVMDDVSPQHRRNRMRRVLKLCAYALLSHTTDTSRDSLPAHHCLTSVVCDNTVHGEALVETKCEGHISLAGSRTVVGANYGARVPGAGIELPSRGV